MSGIGNISKNISKNIFVKFHKKKIDNKIFPEKKLLFCSRRLQTYAGARKSHPWANIFSSML